MRTDALGPRTWLLAAIAGWALLVWALALFGLGARISPLADDPSLVAPLPKLPAQARERLGPLTQYSEIAARPLFAENRKPQPFFISGEEGGEQTKTFDFVLSSVLITPRLQLAILQPAAGGEGIRLKLGESPDSAPGWRLVEIQPRSVVFDGPEGARTLELRIFDGNGGQAPTAVMPAPMPGSPRPGPGPNQPNPAGVPVPPPMPSVSPTTPRTTQVQPANAGPGGAPQPAPSAEAPMTTEQQMDAIRRRIEARRAQLRQQNQNAPPPNNTQ